MNIKNIHIGKLIKNYVVEMNISEDRILNFFNCSHQELNTMYSSEELTTNNLLKWSKLTKYDFFRIYSDHLILYSPPCSTSKRKIKSQYGYRKNVYTPEIVQFIMSLIESKEKTIPEIIKEYNIPKTTLYKWNRKYRSNYE